MTKKHAILFLCWFYALVVFSWQDDAEIYLRDPLENFSNKEGLRIFPAARSEVRLGKYIEHDENHSWRGGVLGDIVFMSFTPNWLWRWSLNMETLADNNNDISFRLVQIYYQSVIGVFWHVGPGVLSFAFNHRCSHGTDDATPSRILIRTGPEINYELPFLWGKLQLLLKSSVNAYLLGQNSDHSHQSRGHASIAMQLYWPVYGSLSMLLASSFGEELIAHGYRTFFLINAKADNFRLRPFGGVRVGMSYLGEKVRSDYSFSFSHISDTGLHKQAQAHNGLSFDINFFW